MNNEINWNAIGQRIRHTLEMALARHPKISASITFGEGEKLITELSASMTYDIRKMMDPEYDTE